ncbi:hypothetical protein [Sphingopyxis sp.]|uniref:hypothetical protein n=1 Tax=Sphingopyxis sp. TaxID=1908224 RepID=UPI003BAB82E5
MDQWIAWAGTALSVFITAAGFYMGWRRYQSDSLRSRDVAVWADKAIAMLLTVELCAKPETPIGSDEQLKRLTDAYFTLSALTEQGRLFFVNVGARDGTRAGGTYEGRRPKLLDPLVIAHKAAERLIERPEAAGKALHAVLREQRKAFVAHVQSEIGRRQTIAKDSRKGGETPDLDAMIAAAA